MRERFTNQAVLGILLVCQFSVCLGTETPDANDSTKYLDAVREFADNVLKYGRDTYGPKHTQLFVDGLNIHTHEPVKWIDPDGTKWILSNFASQQTLMRTLDGLSNITGDAKYRDAAKQAIRYVFGNLRAPNGLIYWGHVAAYNAEADEVFTYYDHHTLKIDYPYYELMWQTDPNATQEFIEAYWSAHVFDWSNLDFNRGALYSDILEEPWNHEFRGGPVPFEGKGGFFTTGTSLTHAAALLSQFSCQKQPLIWGKRLIQRYVDTRDPKIGISIYAFNSPNFRTRTFPIDPYIVLDYPEERHVHPWLSVLLVGQMLGENGKEFIQWASEELTAWGKVSYRRKDNSFVPMLIDGTNLEGHVSEDRPIGLNIAKPCPASPQYFWAYCVAYDAISDALIWEMVRSIALGNRFGDIGQTPISTPQLRTDTNCPHAYGLLGFLCLYDKTGNQEFLDMARRIGDNILARQFHRGFFVPSKRHRYMRFDCVEPLALLHLEAAINSKAESVPMVWPSLPQFTVPYRFKEYGVDSLIIYTLTDSNEPPLSLQEAAAMGNMDLVQSLVDGGTDVDSIDDAYFKTALHRAVESHQPEIVRFLLAKGASMNSKGGWRVETPLHAACRQGSSIIAEMLITAGADIDVKNKQNHTPLEVALSSYRKAIAELLVARGAMVSTIHTAAGIGDLDTVVSFLEDGTDVNAKDNQGMTRMA